MADVERGVGSWELVENFFDASVPPERLDELIGLWDAQIADAGMAALPVTADAVGSTFARQIAGVMQILEQLQEAEQQRVDDLLSAFRSAAMVFADDGVLVAANATARRAFAVKAGDSVAALPLGAAERRELGERIAEVAADGGREEILRLRPEGLERVMMLHLKPLAASGGRSQVLVLTSERTWPDAVSGFLERVFGLTATETDVARMLAMGGTVAGVAGATGRKPGTVRSQLHAILEKTGTRTQAELLRLILLLLDSVPVEARARLPAPAAAEPRQRFLRLGDGRRIEILTYGDPAGRPVVWMQSPYGYFSPTRSAEAEMARRGLRILVPFRAGYCGSDPLPGRNGFDAAVDDLRAVMSQLRIASAPLVAVADDIRIALMFARAEPRKVRHVFGIGASFPIRDDDQYRRLIPIARFVRACARYSPRILPFMIRGVQRTIRRGGVERYMRGTFAGVAPDARAFDDPEVAEAIVGGVERMFFRDDWSETAFCAEMVLFHGDWPQDLGHVAAPVTLIHGEADGNSPYESARDYCRVYPDWRFRGYPGAGQLVAYSHWREVLDLVDEAAAEAESEQG